VRSASAAATDYLARARELAPAIAGWADRNEQERRLCGPLLEALHEAAMFRLLLPRSLGGGEVDAPTFVRVMREIAKADASTAWCLGQTTVCSMVSAYMAPDVAARVFGDPRAVLGWGPPAQVEAVREAGGWRVTGTYPFASGGHHATWLGPAAPCLGPDGEQLKRADGSPQMWTFIVPASQVSWSDVWDVTGLRGTGSDTFSVSNLFVPDELAVLRDEPSERREPGRLYRISTYTMFAIGFAGVSLGVARAAMDAFAGMAGGKTPRALSKTLRENPVVQSQIGQAEARLRAAEAFLMRSVEQVWQELEGEITIDQRVLLRMAGSHAIKEAKDVMDTVYYLAGSSAIFWEGPFDRRLRDIHTIQQQLQGRLDHFERVGQWVMGLEPETLFL